MQVGGIFFHCIVSSAVVQFMSSSSFAVCRIILFPALKVSHVVFVVQSFPRLYTYFITFPWLSHGEVEDEPYNRVGGRRALNPASVGESDTDPLDCVANICT